MDNKLQIKITTKEQAVEIKFTGSIDEDVSFDTIQQLSHNMIIFDFQDVTLINSCGIREWIKYLDGIKTTSKIIYKHCPQHIIEQINMVHGFIKDGADVESFYAPYFCEHCDNEEKILLTTTTVINRQAPEIKCSKCQNVMEFDAIEKQYFNFIKR